VLRAAVSRLSPSLRCSDTESRRIGADFILSSQAVRQTSGRLHGASCARQVVKVVRANPSGECEAHVWQINHHTRAMHRKKCQERLKNLWMLACCRQRAGSRPRKMGPTCEKQWLPAQEGQSVSGDSHSTGNEGTYPASTGHIRLTSEIEVLVCLFVYSFPTCLHPIWDT